MGFEPMTFRSLVYWNSINEQVMVDFLLPFLLSFLFLDIMTYSQFLSYIFHSFVYILVLYYKGF